ncbi:MAG: hypothetical protein NC411_10190 [Bacteroides sp.]|nr:hypothetical protein [Bacteroides sp.]
MQTYRDLISEGRLEEALSMLDSMVATCPENGDLLFERGKLRWRLGDRAGATGDYTKAAMINPDGPAAKALENARDIADFFNPDLYNP